MDKNPLSRPLSCCSPVPTLLCLALISAICGGFFYDCVCVRTLILAIIPLRLVQVAFTPLLFALSACCLFLPRKEAGRRPRQCEHSTATLACGDLCSSTTQSHSKLRCAQVPPLSFAQLRRYCVNFRQRRKHSCFNSNSLFFVVILSLSLSLALHWRFCVNCMVVYFLFVHNFCVLVQRQMFSGETSLRCPSMYFSMFYLYASCSVGYVYFGLCT